MNAFHFKISVKKIFSIFLTCVLSTQNIISPVSAEIIPFIPAAAENKINPPLNIAIPDELGEIKESSAAQDSSALVIHIRDAHANYDAQQKIQALIQYLHEQYGVNLLLLEGADRKLETRYMKFFKDNQLNIKTADILMRRGEFNGMEMFLLSQDNDAVQGFGIEDTQLYRQDIEHFRAMIRVRAQSQEALSLLTSKMEIIESHVLKNGLRDFTHEWRLSQQERNDFMRFIGILEKESRAAGKDIKDPRHQNQYPSLARLSKVREIEDKLDAPAAAAEKQKLRAFLKDKIDASLLAALEAISFEKNGKPSVNPRFTLEKIYQAARDHGLSYNSYPAFALLCAYQILTYEIESEALFAEIESLTNEIMASLAKTEEEKAAIALIKDIEQIKKLFALKLIRKDYDAILSRSAAFSAADLEKRMSALSHTPVSFPDMKDYETIFKTAMDFYATAIARENSFVEKTVQTMRQTGQLKAVLLTGGFHSEGVLEQFKQAGMSYISAIPHIQGMQPDSHENYIAAMMSEQTETSAAHANIATRLISPANRIALFGYAGEAPVAATLGSILQNTYAQTQFLPESISERPEIAASLGQTIADKVRTKRVRGGERLDERLPTAADAVPALEFLDLASTHAAATVSAAQPVISPLAADAVLDNLTSTADTLDMLSTATWNPDAVFSEIGEGEAPEIHTVLTQAEGEAPVVPAGWTAAASNPNFAFGTRSENGVVTLQLMNLTDNSVQDLATQRTSTVIGQSSTFFGSVYDVSPDNYPGGPVVVYHAGSSSYRATGSSTIVKRVGSNQSVSLPGYFTTTSNLDRVAFGANGQITVIQANSTYGISTRQIVTVGATGITKENLPIIEVPVELTNPNDPRVHVGDQAKVVITQLSRTGGNGDGYRIAIFDSSRDNNDMRYVRDIGITSDSGANFTFTDSYITSSGRKIIAVGLDADHANHAVFVDAVTGQTLKPPFDATNLAKTAAITSLRSRQGDIATFTTLNQDGTAGVLVVNLDTLAVLPYIELEQAANRSFSEINLFDDDDESLLNDTFLIRDTTRIIEGDQIAVDLRNGGFGGFGYNTPRSVSDEIVFSLTTDGYTSGADLRVTVEDSSGKKAVISGLELERNARGLFVIPRSRLITADNQPLSDVRAFMVGTIDGAPQQGIVKIGVRAQAREIVNPNPYFRPGDKPYIAVSQYNPVRLIDQASSQVILSQNTMTITYNTETTGIAGGGFSTTPAKQKLPNLSNGQVLAVVINPISGNLPDRLELTPKNHDGQRAYPKMIPAGTTADGKQVYLFDPLAFPGFDPANYEAFVAVWENIPDGTTRGTTRQGSAEFNFFTVNRANIPTPINPVSGFSYDSINALAADRSLITVGRVGLTQLQPNDALRISLDSQSGINTGGINYTFGNKAPFDLRGQGRITLSVTSQNVNPGDYFLEFKDTKGNTYKFQPTENQTVYTFNAADMPGLENIAFVQAVSIKRIPTGSVTLGLRAQAREVLAPTAGLTIPNNELLSMSSPGIATIEINEAYSPEASEVTINRVTNHLDIAYDTRTPIGSGTAGGGLNLNVDPAFDLTNGRVLAIKGKFDHMPSRVELISIDSTGGEHKIPVELRQVSSGEEEIWLISPISQTGFNASNVKRVVFVWDRVDTNGTADKTGKASVGFKVLTPLQPLDHITFTASQVQQAQINLFYPGSATPAKTYRFIGTNTIDGAQFRGGYNVAVDRSVNHQSGAGIAIYNFRYRLPNDLEVSEATIQHFNINRDTLGSPTTVLPLAAINEMRQEGDLTVIRGISLDQRSSLTYTLDLNGQVLAQESSLLPVIDSDAGDASKITPLSHTSEHLIVLPFGSAGGGTRIIEEGTNTSTVVVQAYAPDQGIGVAFRDFGKIQTAFRQNGSITLGLSAATVSENTQVRVEVEISRDGKIVKDSVLVNVPRGTRNVTLKTSDFQNVDLSRETVVRLYAIATESATRISLKTNPISSQPLPEMFSPYDTNQDRHIAPIDVLRIINYLNARISNPSLAYDPYLDVNMDGHITPLDALLIINYLNERTGITTAEGEAAFEDLSGATDQTAQYQQVGNSTIISSGTSNLFHVVTPRGEGEAPEIRSFRLPIAPDSKPQDYFVSSLERSDAEQLILQTSAGKRFLFDLLTSEISPLDDLLPPSGSSLGIAAAATRQELETYASQVRGGGDINSIAVVAGDVTFKLYYLPGANEMILEAVRAKLGLIDAADATELAAHVSAFNSGSLRDYILQSLGISASAQSRNISVVAYVDGLLNREAAQVIARAMAPGDSILAVWDVDANHNAQPDSIAELRAGAAEVVAMPKAIADTAAVQRKTKDSAAPVLIISPNANDQTVVTLEKHGVNVVFDEKELGKMGYSAGEAIALVKEIASATDSRRELIAFLTGKLGFDEQGDYLIAGEKFNQEILAIHHAFATSA